MRTVTGVVLVSLRVALVLAAFLALGFGLYTYPAVMMAIFLAGYLTFYFVRNRYAR